MGRIWKVLTRKKAIDPVTAEETRLSRVLNVFDLTALGVGSTLGVGVYVLAGQVAYNTAGPSVVLSFLIAGIASVFAGLCYAEFGARAPRAGSAYIYSYVCVGEFIAFVIGWNLILEYVIGSASVARGLSLYLDTLINNTLQDTFREIAPINVAYLASYFDFFSFGISILLAISLAFGLKESSMANNIVTCLNIAVVLFVIIAGALKADPANWRISPNSTNTTNSTDMGTGGFFPWGVNGMIKGAATCFYGFVGFDCIATTGEEVKNPRKAIPVAIVVSLFIIFLAYFGVATVLTLMVPYYELDYNAPIPRAFEAMGWEVAKWIVAIGALFGLCASLFGAMFPLPRIIYAMGSDGLVFKFLAKVHPRFQTPIVGTILAGFLTGLMSALFDLSQLVNMMSIGTLQAYTIVAASVLLLRYNDDAIRQNFDGPTTSDEQELIANDSPSVFRSLRYIINCTLKEPNRITENIVAVEVFLYCVLCIATGVCVIYLKTNMANGETWAIVVTSVIVGLTIMVLISLATQPTSKKELSFKVPLIPFIPALSILVNIYLMLMLDYMTWVRFAVWMAVGIPMYCVCACTQKPPEKPQNGGNYATNITNGHAKMPNGISNPSFVHTDTNGEQMKQKPARKKAAPPPPTIFEQKETIEVQEEAAIAQLDEILEKEVAIAQLDDILNNETISTNDRKLSAGTLSNMSAVVSHSEDVVADVHCANVVTPVADPKSLPFPIVSDNPSYLDTVENSSALIDTMHDNEPEVPVSVKDDIIEPIPGDAPETNFKELSIDLSADDTQTSRLEEGDISPLVYDINMSDKPLEHVILTSEASHKGIEAVLNSPIVSSAQNSEEPVHNNDDGVPKTETNNISPENKPLKKSDEPVILPPVPNEEALKTVNLRHVKKLIKQIEPTNNQNASDDNLKVGSEEYKNFIRDLDNKLKRTTVVPQFYVARQKHVVVQPTQVVSNENVIEDHIDQVDAKEKLKMFYATRNFANEEPKTDNPKRVLYGSKSVDESLFDAKDENDTRAISENLDVSEDDILSSKSEDVKNVSENSKSKSYSDLEVHKSKMANVFNSIQSKKLDTEGRGTHKRRLSRSLGPSFLKKDDEINHKQKMDDIFKSIKALRNENK